MTKHLKFCRIIVLILLAAFFSRGNEAGAVDLFAELAMPAIPVAVRNPSWVTAPSLLKIEYSFDEYYKRWLDNSLVNDFSGYRFNTEISAEPAAGFLFGVRKTFFERQKWMNHVADRSESFNVESDSEAGELFFRFKRKNSALEIGRGSGKSLYQGTYDLHPDIVAALGKNPPIYLNNGFTNSYVRGFSEFKRLKLLLDYSSSKPAHRLSASTPAMNVVLNLDRKVEQKGAEISWNTGKRFFAFFRHCSYEDKGDGINSKDVKFLFGNNKSRVNLVTNSLGFSFPIKSSKCFIEWSRVDFDSFLSSEINLITLNPLFLFGTNQVDYKMNFNPGSGWGARIGAEKKFRRFELAGQYSFLSLNGRSAQNSRKFYNFFAAEANEVTFTQIDLNLHRMEIEAKKKDRCGLWSIKLNLMVPLADSEEIKPVTPPGPPGPAVPAKVEPREFVRGGWQVSICRELKL